MKKPNKRIPNPKTTPTFKESLFSKMTPQNTKILNQSTITRKNKDHTP